MAISCACFAKLEQISQELMRGRPTIRHFFHAINHAGLSEREKIPAGATGFCAIFATGFGPNARNRTFEVCLIHYMLTTAKNLIDTGRKLRWQAWANKRQ